ncbi:hypothetical protein J6590_093595, partial [Homalodisca vitripennis]
SDRLPSNPSTTFKASRTSLPRVLHRRRRTDCPLTQVPHFKRLGPLYLEYYTDADGLSLGPLYLEYYTDADGLTAL